MSSCTSESSSCSSDDSSSNVDERRRSEMLPFVEGVFNPQPNVYCFVCRKNNKRAKVADVRGLLQHCNTAPALRKRHGLLKKMLQEEQEKRGIDLGSVIGKVGVKKGDKSSFFSNVSDENLGKVVSPFTLVLQNVACSPSPCEPCDLTALKILLTTETGQLMQKRQAESDRPVGDTSKQTVEKIIPVEVGVFTDFFAQDAARGYKLTGFAVYEKHADLDLVSAEFENAGKGRAHWEKFEVNCRRTKHTEQGLFAYKAKVEDVQKLDPERRWLKEWKAVDYRAAVYEPLAETRTKQAELRKRGVEIENSKRRLLELKEEAKTDLEKHAKTIEKGRKEIEEKEKELEKSVQLERKRREEWQRVQDAKVAKYQEICNSKAVKIANLKFEDNPDLQDMLLREIFELKQLKNNVQQLEELKKEHEKKLGEQARQMTVLEQQLRRVGDKFDTTTERLASMKEKLSLAEKEQQDFASKLKEPLGQDEADPTQVKEVKEKLVNLGMNPESLDNISSKCGDCKCLFTPAPDTSLKEKDLKAYNKQMGSVRAFLIPCGCATKCVGCAKRLLKRTSKNSRRCAKHKMPIMNYQTKAYG